MKRLSIFFAALLLSVSSMMAEGVAYTVKATHGASSSYTTECDIVVNGITWKVQGNTNMNGSYPVSGWAVGGKSITNTERAIYSQDIIKGATGISKVVVTHKANNGIIVNSFALIVSDAINAGGDTIYATAADIAHMANNDAIVTFSIPTETRKKKYYKFLYNLTNKETKNKRIEFLKAEFIGGYHVIGATDIALDKTTLELEQYTTANLIATVTPANATTPIVWTSSNESVARVANGVVTAIDEGSATITAAAGVYTAACKVIVTAVRPDTLTCAEVVEQAAYLKDNEILAGGKRIVRGYVTEYYKNPAADFEQYGNYSVYMADTKDGGKVFEAYQVRPVDGNTVVKIGNFVEVIGEITKYKETVETVGRGMSTIDVLNTPTAVEDVRAKAAITMKVVKDGQMIIIRNGVCYNAVGAVIE